MKICQIFYKNQTNFQVEILRAPLCNADFSNYP